MNQAPRDLMKRAARPTSPAPSWRPYHQSPMKVRCGRRGPRADTAGEAISHRPSATQTSSSRERHAPDIAWRTPLRGGRADVRTGFAERAAQPESCARATVPPSRLTRNKIIDTTSSIRAGIMVSTQRGDQAGVHHAPTATACRMITRCDMPSGTTRRGGGGGRWKGHQGIVRQRRLSPMKHQALRTVRHRRRSRRLRSVRRARRRR